MVIAQEQTPGSYWNVTTEEIRSGEINPGELANSFINVAEDRQRFGP
jgi:hypothetical protein